MAFWPWAFGRNRYDATDWVIGFRYALERATVGEPIRLHLNMRNYVLLRNQIDRSNSEIERYGLPKEMPPRPITVTEINVNRGLPDDRIFAANSAGAMFLVAWDMAAPLKEQSLQPTT